MLHVSKLNAWYRLHTPPSPHPSHCDSRLKLIERCNVSFLASLFTAHASWKPCKVGWPLILQIDPFLRGCLGDRSHVHRHPQLGAHCSPLCKAPCLPPGAELMDISAPQSPNVSITRPPWGSPTEIRPISWGKYAAAWAPPPSVYGGAPGLCLAEHPFSLLLPPSQGTVWARRDPSPLPAFILADISFECHPHRLL